MKPLNKDRTRFFGLYDWDGRKTLDKIVTDDVRESLNLISEQLELYRV